MALVFAMLATSLLIVRNAPRHFSVTLAATVKRVHRAMAMVLVLKVKLLRLDLFWGNL